jgi:hypothetical protein
MARKEKQLTASAKLLALASERPEIDKQDYGSDLSYYHEDIKACRSDLARCRNASKKIKAAGEAWLESYLTKAQHRVRYASYEPGRVEYVAGQNYATEFRDGIADVLEIAARMQAQADSEASCTL